MKPVFKEELEFLNIPINDKLWVDSRCYYVFDKEYNKVKLGRSIDKIPSDLSMYLTHNEYTHYYYTNFTENKVEIEKVNLENYLKTHKYDDIIISVSGGKDSTIVADISLDICKKYYNTRIIFANTTNETHYTYRYVKQTYSPLEILNPAKGFYQWCKDNKFIPTRVARACCSIFKEGNIIPYLDNTKKLLHICGIRKSESLNRSTYTQVRKGKWDNKLAQENWDMYLPIIEFDDLDVWAYLLHNKIKFNQLYRFGYNRVGCTNCPYRTDYELKLNEHFLPTYDEHWKKLLTYIFIENGISAVINCTLDEFLNGAWKAGVYREKATFEVINEFAQFKGISYEKAERYFKSNTCTCGKKLSKDAIALNMKLLGRETDTRLCLKCLANLLGTTQKQLKKDIENFKKDGCQLF